jgi:hypothetical protein
VKHGDWKRGRGRREKESVLVGGERVREIETYRTMDRWEKESRGAGQRRDVSMRVDEVSEKS